MALLGTVRMVVLVMETLSKYKYNEHFAENSCPQNEDTFSDDE